MARPPKVSIVTPVYNGERFIAEAIESVLAQTYTNWDYVIADNGSGDGTFAIAARYAERDPRIRAVRLPHVPIMDNWNRALGLVGNDAAYVKELHADDLLLPNCLAEMVALMERHPSAGMVSSYSLYDSTVSNVGLPLGSELLSGPEVIRSTLRNDWYLFGNPSSVMLRHSVVREMGPELYDPSLRHADIDTWYRILERHDFAFVHQVLSCERTHDESQTNTFTARYSTLALEPLCFIRHFGPRYLPHAEYLRVYRATQREYRRRLARRMFGGAGMVYWRYHERQLARFGYRLGIGDLVAGAMAEFVLWVLDDRHATASRRKLLAKIRRRVRSRSRILAAGTRRLMTLRHLVLRQPFYRLVSVDAGRLFAGR